MPLVLAALAYITFNYVGIKKYGFSSTSSRASSSRVCRFRLHFLLIPIEFLSTFVLRPFTLMVRLMANMLAGHILLVLFFSATQYFFFTSGGFQAIFGVPSIIAGVAMTFFELLVIGLQAYVFRAAHRRVHRFGAPRRLALTTHIVRPAPFADRRWATERERNTT